MQVHLFVYPDLLRPDVHKHGYIWNVFVEPDYRGQGISRRLTQLAVEHLRSVGCTYTRAACFGNRRASVRVGNLVDERNGGL